MKPLFLAMEETLAVDQAIEYVEKSDSTDDADQEQVKTYKEYLDELKEKKDLEEESESDFSTDDSANTSDEKADSDSSDESSEDTKTDSETSSDDNSASDDTKEEEAKAEEDKEKESDKKAQESLESFASSLEQCVQDYNCLAKIHNELLVADIKGKTSSLSLESYSDSLNDIQKRYNLDLTPANGFYFSYASAGYSDSRKQLKSSLEGFKEVLVKVGEYVVKALKFLAEWIKEYIFYDPARELEFDRGVNKRINESRSIEIKVRQIERFKAVASAKLSNTQYRARSTLLINKDADMTGAQVSDSIRDTVNTLAAYWVATNKIIEGPAKNVLASTESFLYQNNLSGDVLFMNPNKGYFSAMDLVKVSGDKERYYSGYSLPNPFSVFTTKNTISGRVKLILVFPEYGVTYDEALKIDPNSYSVFMKRDADMSNARRGIYYTAEIMELKKGLEAIINLQPIVKAVYTATRNFGRALDDAANRMTNDLRRLMNSQSTPVVEERKEVQLLNRYNINVLSNFVVRPLKATLDYNHRVKKAYLDFYDSNFTMLNAIVAEAEQQRKDLGI